MAQDEDDEEGDDDEIGHIDYYTNIEHNWSFGGEDCTFFDQKEGLDVLFEALRAWRPYEERDWFVELKTLFEEEGEKDDNDAGKIYVCIAYKT